MAVTPFFDPDKAGRPMRVAAFMSGSGTNIIKLLDRQKALQAKEGSSPFEVVFIFSDSSDGSCRGEGIACQYGLPYFSHDIRAFHRLRGVKRSVATPQGLLARREFDGVARRLVEAFAIDMVALGGYMSYTTVERCINVHPADLSILTHEGKRKYVGDHAVLDAILGGESHIRASTLWTDQGVDTGPLLMVSDPVTVALPGPLESLIHDRERLKGVAAEHQARLKEIGDWKIFPETVEMIARGRFAVDEAGRVYADGRPVPQGFRK